MRLIKYLNGRRIVTCKVLHIVAAENISLKQNVRRSDDINSFRACMTEKGLTYGKSIPAKKTSGSRGCIVFLIGLPLTLVIGWLVGVFIDSNISGGTTPFIAMFGVWLIGLIVTIRTARN